MFIRRISPFYEMADAIRAFDDLFVRRDRAKPDQEAEVTWTPAVESFRRENEIALLVELPGVEPEKVQLELTGSLLTISGERAPRGEARDDFYLQEIARGRFSRSFKLPVGARTEEVRAQFHNGMLEVTIPLAGPAVSRRIPLQAVASAAVEKDKAA